MTHRACAQLKDDIFQCTFEEGHNCGFSPLYDGTYANWRLYRGSETTIKTFDHTLKTLNGHYYALDYSSLSEKVSYNYRIASKVFSPTRGSCVTFSYYLRGLTDSDKLEFYIKPENVNNFVNLRPLWYAKGDLGPFWYSHRRTITSTLNWQIAFNGIAEDTREGLIAIDDVMVEIDKPCPPNGRCDFEVIIQLFYEF